VQRLLSTHRRYHRQLSRRRRLLLYVLVFFTHTLDVWFVILIPLLAFISCLHVKNGDKTMDSSKNINYCTKWRAEVPKPGVWRQKSSGEGAVISEEKPWWVCSTGRVYCDVDDPPPLMFHLSCISVLMTRRCWRTFTTVVFGDVATNGSCHGAPASHRSQGCLWVRRTNSLTPTFLTTALATGLLTTTRSHENNANS